MRLFRLITTGLLLAIVGLFIYQNLPTFDSPIAFSLDLYIHEPFPWSLQLYTVIGIAALLGCILGVLLMLKPYLKLRRILFQARQEKPQPPEEQPGQDNAPTSKKTAVLEGATATGTVSDAAPPETSEPARTTTQP
jgi:hypothetical protein